MKKETPLISVENVSLSYDGENTVLSDVSFSVRPGTLYCLMGANGCGKSTLINCILGIHAPDRGRVLISGREVEKYRPKELAKKISFIPQVHERTFPYTVEQIVLMGRNAYGSSFSGPGSRRQTDRQRSTRTDRNLSSGAASVYAHQRRRDAACHAGTRTRTEHIGRHYGRAFGSSGFPE